MKLLVVLCLEEYRQTVSAIFKKAEIGIFSALETTGFKGFAPATLLDDWFSSGGDAFSSALMFSFTTVDLAAKALLLVKQYNIDNPTSFPIRAFIMPVDASSYEN